MMGSRGVLTPAGASRSVDADRHCKQPACWHRGPLAFSVTDRLIARPRSQDITGIGVNTVHSHRVVPLVLTPSRVWPPELGVR